MPDLTKDAEERNGWHAAHEDTVAVFRPRTSGSPVVDEALKIVSGPRNDHYGPPEDDLVEIGRAWAAYLTNCLGVYVPDLSGRQVCGLMGIMKWIRDAYHEKPDNLVDQVGYTLCAERCTKVLDELEDEDGAA